MIGGALSPVRAGSEHSAAATVLFSEDLDRLVPPALPAGWTASMVRVAGIPDLLTAASSPSSAPNAILGSNATVDQWLMTCPLDRRVMYPAALSFALRRSSTFTARCVVEASTDGGLSFAVAVGEAPAVFPSSEYQTVEMPLPVSLADADSFRLRWHFLAAGTGTTATVRIDDVRLVRPRAVIGRGTVAINEIMAQPIMGQPEWIELINTGPADVDVGGWTLRDAPSGTAHTVAAGVPLLGPGAMLVLTADSMAMRTAVNGPCTIVQPEGYPSLNNGGDLLLLADEHGVVMDSVRYEAAWGGNAGVSLERIDPSGPSVASWNWGTCLASGGSTPGQENSIVIQPYDLCMSRFTGSGPASPAQISLQAVVRNAGDLPSSPFTIVITCADTANAGTITIATVACPFTLAKGESVSVPCTWMAPRPGRSRVTATIVWPPDQRPANDAASCDVQVPIAAGALRINEIQAAPLIASAEFIEIINASDAPVSLEGCFITDRHHGVPQPRRWMVTDHPAVLGAGGLSVIAGDSSVATCAGPFRDRCMIVSKTGLGLNNDADTVLLYGADTVLVDSVVYHAAWHSATVPDPAGRSLERYQPQLASGDPRSWGTCVDPAGSTPGRPNSILLRAPRAGAMLACAPDPFSPDADGYDDVTIVRYELPGRSSLIRIRVYDIRGRCVRDLVNAAPAGMAGEVVWDGMGDGRVPLRIGIYIIHLESVDDEHGAVVEAKCGVVLARRL